MEAFLVVILLVVLPLVSLISKPSDLDDRDRRGWFPTARAH
jgi:hypothetical protein